MNLGACSSISRLRLRLWFRYIPRTGCLFYTVEYLLKIESINNISLNKLFGTKKDIAQCK